jgi:Fur family ferric uptake transcriptional regulator
MMATDNIFHQGLAMTHWEQCLAGAGCRITASRRAVMRALRDANEPLVPAEILEQGRAAHQGLGLVTVYRTLNLMSRLGVVRRIHRESGCHAYLLASPGDNHLVICDLCGRAAGFRGGDDLDALIGRVEARTGYLADEQLIQLTGRCPECQAARG